MNPIFSPIGEGWPEFPRRSYGRLDQTEPLDVANATEALFAFDVVDANWPAFGPLQEFDLSDALTIESRMRVVWQGLGLGASSVPDPFDGAPIYRIEVTARRGDRFFAELESFRETDWVEIALNGMGSYEVDVFGGLFAAPTIAHLDSITIAANAGHALSAAFDMNTWPDATDQAIVGALSSVPKLSFLGAHDVGQGSANALMDAAEDTEVFFDLGCGVYRNAATRPTPLRFCWRANPPIVLSHWDSDHWAGETCDAQAAGRVWIAPRQSITMKHTAFASRILSAGGSILIWGAPPGAILTSTLPGGQELRLARCSGTSRNGSGISCIVIDTTTDEGWVLTGDAGYHELAQTLPATPRAVVAPHHGADMGSASLPPSRPMGYARLLYSFGPGNKHGRTGVSHPASAGINAHSSNGWSHGAWGISGPATVPASADALGTAFNPFTHLEGAVASWSSAPAVPFVTVPCAGVPPGPTGCTGRMAQS